MLAWNSGTGFWGQVGSWNSSCAPALGSNKNPKKSIALLTIRSPGAAGQKWHGTSSFGLASFSVFADFLGTPTRPFFRTPLIVLLFALRDPAWPSVPVMGVGQSALS